MPTSDGSSSVPMQLVVCVKWVLKLTNSHYHKSRYKNSYIFKWNGVRVSIVDKCIEKNTANRYGYSFVRKQLHQMKLSNLLFVLCSKPVAILLSRFSALTFLFHVPMTSATLNEQSHRIREGIKIFFILFWY